MTWAVLLDMPYAQVDVIAKMIPQELNITIDRALEMNPELKKAYEEQEEYPQADRYGKASGRASPPYVHARRRRGDQPESRGRICSLSRAQDGSITTQFTMTTLEELGL